MTVAIEVVSADGVVLATDSRTTLNMAPTRVLSDFTHKVFRAGDKAIGTWGWAFLERRNVAGHVAEFVQRADLSGSVQDLAGELSSFFGERIDRHLDQGLDSRPPEGTYVLGFLVGGYEEGAGRTYEVLLPSRTVVPLHDSVSNPGAAWRGQTDVIRRLVKGADLDVLAMFAEADGKSTEYEALLPTLAGLEYVIPFAHLNLQDAIDFAVFAIRTTIDTQRLTYGVQRSPGSWPGVGGPIEIAAVTPVDGFRWVQQTRLQGERGPGEAEEL